jgi:hypothetical protein
MAEYYEKINWKNGADGGTPLSAENLNKMEEGISGAEMRTGPLEYDKENNTFSAGDRIQLDANGNLKVSGTITDGNGNVLGASGGSELPWYVAEAEIFVTEDGWGQAMFMISDVAAKDVAFVAPLMFTVPDVKLIYTGQTIGDEETPGAWYITAEMSDPRFANTTFMAKALIWKK